MVQNRPRQRNKAWGVGKRQRRGGIITQVEILAKKGGACKNLQINMSGYFQKNLRVQLNGIWDSIENSFQK